MRNMSVGYHGHCPNKCGMSFKLNSDCSAWRYCVKDKERVIIKSCLCSKQKKNMRRKEAI
jgi:hypothetical protein